MRQMGIIQRTRPFVELASLHPKQDTAFSVLCAETLHDKLASVSIDYLRAEIILLDMKTPLVLILLLTSSIAFSQGPGNTLKLDGVDDYVNLGNIYDDLSFPFSVSVWANIADGSGNGGPVFVSQDNTGVYNGFWFYVNPTSVSLEYGDGFGENNPAYRRGKSATISNISNRWTHVTAVVTAIDNIKLYVNGVDVGGSATGSSTNPMSSNFPADDAKIGYFFSNGVVYRFKGQIDDLRVYNKSLTVDEIRQDMCRKIPASTPGLIGYWPFDETSGSTLNDRSSKGFNGQINGNPQRLYSGAPIGDESAFLYTSSWSGKSLSLGDLTASNITGTPSGIHLYKVNDAPSQSGGLPTSSNHEYYGAFAASGATGKQFDLAFSDSHCMVFRRYDNTVAAWNEITALTGFIDRTEVITNDAIASLKLDLGEDKILCDQGSFLLQSGVPTETDRSFMWNTAETTPDITITTSGRYILTITENSCELKDTVNVSFLTDPPSFSLGPDRDVCSVTPLELKPYENSSEYRFKWQDGSTAPTYQVSDFGEYWVEASNGCGIARDTITFTDLHGTPYIVDLGEDKIICDQSTFVLKSGVDTGGRTFLWNTGEAISDIVVNQPGKYILTVSDVCVSLKDSVNISFANTPPAFSLGDDQALCPMTQRVLMPYEDPDGYEFLWHDGSTQPVFVADDFGTYSVEVKSVCGTAAASVTFSPETPLGFIIPNVITPNGDGYNQFFVVEPLLEDCSLQIYNRWGKTVFASNNYDNTWDALAQTGGVYFYVLSNECIGEKRGSIHVLK